MEFQIIEILLSGIVGLLSAIVSIIWVKADNACRISQSNKIILEQLSQHIHKTNELTERLSSLEASFSVEIKNLSVSIKRMESALIRIDQNASHRPR